MKATQRPLRRDAAGMLYTLPGGRVLSIEVIARLEMSPGAFDDCEGIIVATVADASGFIVFAVGAKLASGEDFAEFRELPDAYNFALELARTHADAFLDACRAEVEANDPDPMGTHHGRNE